MQNQTKEVPYKIRCHNKKKTKEKIKKKKANAHIKYKNTTYARQHAAYASPNTLIPPHTSTSDAHALS
jgi:hypothetical protein